MIPRNREKKQSLHGYFIDETASSFVLATLELKLLLHSIYYEGEAKAQ